MPLIVIAAVALLVGIDQLIKLWASQTLAAVGNIPVIEGVFEFSYVENRGAPSAFCRTNAGFLLY